MTCEGCSVQYFFICTHCNQNLCISCYYNTYIVNNPPPCRPILICHYCSKRFPVDLIKKIFVHTLDWFSCDLPLIGGEIWFKTTRYFLQIRPLSYRIQSSLCVRRLVRKVVKLSATIYTKLSYPCPGSSVDYMSIEYCRCNRRITRALAQETRLGGFCPTCELRFDTGDLDSEFNSSDEDCGSWQRVYQHRRVSPSHIDGTNVYDTVESSSDSEVDIFTISSLPLTMDPRFWKFG